MPKIIDYSYKFNTQHTFYIRYLRAINFFCILSSFQGLYISIISNFIILIKIKFDIFSIIPKNNYLFFTKNYEQP